MRKCHINIIAAALNCMPGQRNNKVSGFYMKRFIPKNDSGCVDVTNLEVKPEYASLEGFNYDADNTQSFKIETQ